MEDKEKIMDLQDKMSEMHRDMYRQMLGLNELPLPLLERYFLVKKMYDKISGPMTVGDMVRIALDIGFNPETMRFEDVVIPAGTMMAHVVAPEKEPESGLPVVTEKIEEIFQEYVADKPVAGAGLIPEGTVIDSETKTVIAEPGEEMETSTNVIEETTTDFPVKEAAEEPEKPVEEEKPEPEPAEEDPDDVEILPIGTQVVVLFKENGEEKYFNGKVNGSKEDKDGELIYSIETEENILEDIPRENLEVN